MEHSVAIFTRIQVMIDSTNYLYADNIYNERAKTDRRVSIVTTEKWKRFDT